MRPTIKGEHPTKGIKVQDTEMSIKALHHMAEFLTLSPLPLLFFPTTHFPSSYLTPSSASAHPIPLYLSPLHPTLLLTLHQYTIPAHFHTLPALTYYLHTPFHFDTRPTSLLHRPLPLHFTSTPRSSPTSHPYTLPCPLHAVHYTCSDQHTYKQYLRHFR